MENIVNIISLMIIIGLIASPFLILWLLGKLKIRWLFFYYLLIGIVTTATLTLTFAWWNDTPNELLLAHYGYNINGENATEIYGHVSVENMNRVKSLETSIMGIGWTVKAIISYLVYSPYLLLVYLIVFLIKKIRRNKTIKQIKI